jgi:thiamine-monophosphate kinase
VRVAAGDDCAVVGGAKDRWWSLLKTDAVIEGVHFLADADPARVGWKALCRAISDIAAMGGTAEHALITLAAPATTSLRWAQELYRGLRRAGRKYGVSIVGGETARSPKSIFINVALTGRVPRRNCVLRSGGKAGDFLYVTGRLGGSLAGKHLDFHPRVEEARWLAATMRPSAMMDVSDGLAADLPRLAEASGCDFSIEPAAVPCSAGCSIRQALGDGEDFELLFAIPASRAARLEIAWKQQFPRLPLTRIGALAPRSRRKQKLSAHGYDHFA